MASITRRSRATTDTSPPAAMDRLVEAFERLLARGESFTTISVEELAREAGMARATFYLHCRNKGQLVSHAMQAVQLQLKTAARARLKKSGSYGRTEFQAFMREPFAADPTKIDAIRTKPLLQRDGEPRPTRSRQGGRR